MLIVGGVRGFIIGGSLNPSHSKLDHETPRIEGKQMENTSVTTEIHSGEVAVNSDVLGANFRAANDDHYQRRHIYIIYTS